MWFCVARMRAGVIDAGTSPRALNVWGGEARMGHV